MTRQTERAYRLTAVTGLHRGDREYQQDQVKLLPHPRVDGCLMGLVADGMGGRTGGRKAANQVILTATQLFDGYDPASDDGISLLRQIAEEAHLVIQLTAITTEQEPHSTIAAFIIDPGGRCHWLHSGDSRLYHFRGNHLLHRTQDHSYVNQLVQQGELSEQQANIHPQSNILLSCLGATQAPELSSHTEPRLEIGDTLLVCSDGLWHYFSNDELASVLGTLPPREASELLIRKARQRAGGGGDNLSLIIVRLEHAPQPRRKPPSSFAPLK